MSHLLERLGQKQLKKLMKDFFPVRSFSSRTLMKKWLSTNMMERTPNRSSQPP